ncbi:hypothetical protein SAMN02745887_00593 [Chitinimonas taiwanensis DSM 18899]|uniref:Uncharacterized protein n=1 Tax=Chitinimonas taiwanensis DSM 18899 TaxID=1121279 RepID=A0A1K2H7D2_9NEIS|nr:hypothetical protein SAMN02745887_00593 [Chitinimonas taiwanensis DSM 18899]
MTELSSTPLENEPRGMNIKKRPGESPAIRSLQGALAYLAVLNWLKALVSATWVGRSITASGCSFCSAAAFG